MMEPARGFVRAGKLQIGRVDDGITFLVDELLSSDLVDRLKEKIERASAVPVADQILLAEDGRRLEPSQKLEVYGLPNESKIIFLYNRKTLEPDSGFPIPTVPFIELEAPTLPPKPDSNESNPLVVALIAFEHQFLIHLRTAQALRKTLFSRSEVFAKALKEMIIQAEGGRVALADLQESQVQLKKEFSQFWDHYQQRQQAHEALLQAFPQLLHKLGTIQLHPSLATPQRRTLLDCIPEARFRAWYDSCRTSHDQLKARVSELNTQMKALSDAVDAEVKAPLGSDLDTLRRVLQKCNERAADAQAQVLSFEKDYQNVRQRVQAAQTSAGGQAPSWVSCDGFGDIREAHIKQLAQLEEAQKTTRDVHTHFAQSRTAMAHAIFARLRGISNLQSRIRDLYNRTALFRQAQARQDAAVDHLECLRFMPAAYQASLDEVVRRRAFGRRLAADLRRLTERLAQVRNEEMGRREQFLTTHGRYIMKDLVPGLSELLPTFELVCPQFDTGLPVLSVPTPTGIAIDEAMSLLSVSATDDRTAARVRELEQENSRLQHELAEAREREAKRPAAHSPPSGGILSSSDASESNFKSQQLIAGYKERIQQLESKLSTTYAKLSEMEEETRSKAELEVLLNNAVENALKQTEADAERVRRLQQLEGEYASVRAQLDHLQTSLNDANRRASQAADKHADEVELLRKETSRLAEALRKANDELAAARERLSALEPLPDALARVSLDLEQARKSAAQITSELQSANNALLEVRAARESSLRELDAARAELARVKESNAALAAAAKELDHARAQIVDLGASRTSLQSTAAQLEEARAATSRRAEELAAEKSRLESAVARMDQTTKELQDRLQTLVTEKQRLSEEFSAVRSELDGKLREKDKQLNDSVSKLKQITLNNAHQENEIVRLKKAESDIARRLEALTASERHHQEATRRLQDALVGVHKILQVVPLPPEVPGSPAPAQQDFAELQFIQRAVAHLLEINKRLTATITELDTQLARDMSAEKRRSSIVLRDFAVGDLVMFSEVHDGVYQAYNRNYPNHFLSEDSYPAFEAERTKKMVIFGRVVAKYQKTVPAAGDHTKLPPESTYFELLVEREDLSS